MKKILYLTNEKYLGDKSNSKILAETIKNNINKNDNKIKIEIEEFIVNNDEHIYNLQEILMEKEKEKEKEMIIITCAGLKGGEVLEIMIKNDHILKKIKNGMVMVIYSAHQLYDNIKNIIMTNKGKIEDNIVLCFPEHIKGELKKIKKGLNMEKIVFSLTVPTANVKKVIEEKANGFLKDNKKIGEFFDKNKKESVLFYFLGGTSETKDGKWTLFEEKEVKRQVKKLFDVAKKEKVSMIVVVTHGIRTFANPKNDDNTVREKNRYEIYNSLISLLKKNSSSKKISVVVFGKNENTHKQVVIVLNNKGERKEEIDIQGNVYFYAINLASKLNCMVLMTEDQVTGVAELLESGIRKIKVLDFGKVSNKSHKDHRKIVNKKFSKKNAKYIPQFQLVSEKLKGGNFF